VAGDAHSLNGLPARMAELDKKFRRRVTLSFRSWAGLPSFLSGLALLGNLIPLVETRQAFQAFRFFETSGNVAGFAGS
jgi:hypothetical protein